MPALTIRDLLPWLAERGGTVLAGAQHTGLDRVIEGIARPRRIIAREIDAFDAHDLIFATLAAFGSSDLTLEQFIQVVADAQAGLLLIGSPAQAATSQLATLADTLAFPLLQVPATSDATDFAKQLVDFIHQRQVQSARYVRETLAALGAVRRAVTPLLATATALAAQTNTVFILEDEYRVPLVRIIPPQFSFTEAEVTAVLSSYSARQVVRPATPGGVIDDIPLQRRLPLQLCRLIIPVRAHTTVIAYLSLLGTEEHLVPSLADVLGHLAPLVVTEIAQLRHPVHHEYHSAASDLAALFADTLPEDELLQRARTYGYDLALPHHVVVVLPKEPVATEEHASWLWAGLEAVATTLWAMPQGDGIALVVRASAATTDGLHSLWQRFAHASQVTLGVGTSATTLAGLRTSLIEAQHAAAAGAYIVDSHVTRYADLGVMRLLYPLAVDGTLVAFARDVLAPLLGPDVTTADNLLKTLDTWFQVNGNMTEAARRLSLHRNTLIYRLNNIQEALGARLDDAELRLSLQVALKIWRTYPQAFRA